MKEIIRKIAKHNNGFYLRLNSEMLKANTNGYLKIKQIDEESFIVTTV